MRDGFVAIIYRKKGLALEKIDEGGQPDDTNDVLTPPIAKKGTEKGTEKITEKQQIILNYISKNPSITIKELSTNVNIAESKIKENISKLKTKGLLERIGPDKGGYWRVINQIKPNT